MSVILKKQAYLLAKMLLSPDEKNVKRGLQRACDLLERGAVFHNPIELATNVTALLLHDSVKVRRWAFKYLGTSKQRVSNHTIKHLLASYEYETNSENRTWIVASLFSLLSDDELEKYISQGKIQMESSSNLLASQLFYNGRIGAKLKGRQLLLPIDNDPLTAKWDALLYGYGKTDRLVLPTSTNNKDLIKDLVTHDQSEVSEYAIWALHKKPNDSYHDIVPNVTSLLNKDPNVRRWLYRLLSKTPKSTKENYALLKEKMLEDTSVDAREGIAIGLCAHYNKKHSLDIVDWYFKDTSHIVKDTLLEHMAKHCVNDKPFAEALEIIVESDPPSSLSKQRIITNLGDIKSADKIYKVLSKKTIQQLELVDLMLPKEDCKMTKTTNIDARGANFKSGITNLGDMKVKKNNLRTVEHSSEVKEVVEDFKSFLNEEFKNNSKERKQLIKLVDKLLKEKDKSSKGNLAKEILRVSKHFEGAYEKSKSLLELFI